MVSFDFDILACERSSYLSVLVETTMTLPMVVGILEMCERRWAVRIAGLLYALGFTSPLLLFLFLLCFVVVG